MSRPEVPKRRGLLPADQTNQSCPAPQQPCQSRSLASPNVHELHLLTQQRHPTLPQVSSQKVHSTFGRVETSTLNSPTLYCKWRLLGPQRYCSWCLFRIRELFPGTDIEMFAHFISESLKKTKARELVPSQEEIVALLSRQEMTTTVYCHGGGSCKISINSHTTAGEVRLLGLRYFKAKFTLKCNQ